MDQFSTGNTMIHTFEQKEQSKRKRRSRYLKIIFVALVAALIMTSATLGLLSAQTEPLLNELDFGKIGITVDEGDSYDWEQKNVKLVASTGPEYAPGVARVMIVPYILDENSENYISCDLGALSKPVDNKMVLGDVILEFMDDWETKWFYKDGFFYYRTVLYPTTENNANETSILLKKVSLTEEALEKYKDASIKVDVLASILQSEGAGASEEWDVTVVGSAVTPKA